MKKIIIGIFIVVGFMFTVIPSYAQVIEYETLALSEGYNGYIEGDFNNDGLMDFVGYRFNQIAVFINDGELTFSKVVVSNVGSSFYDRQHVQIVDYNKDGYFDIIYINTSQQKMFFVENNKDETFKTPIVLYEGSFVAFLVTDLDNNNSHEIFMSFENGHVIVLKQSETGLTSIDGSDAMNALSLFFGGSSNTTTLFRAIDIGNDGMLDIVFGTSTNEVRQIFFKNIQNSDASTLLATLDNKILDIDAVLINGDSRKDIAITTKTSLSNPHLLHYFPADESTVSYGAMVSTLNVTSLYLGSFSEVLTTRFEYLNNEIFPTLFVGVDNNNGIGLYMFNELDSSGRFLQPTWHKSKNQDVHEILIGDFTGNYAKDILTINSVNSGTSTFRVFENDFDAIKITFDSQGGTPVAPSGQVVNYFGALPTQNFYEGITNIKSSTIHKYDQNDINFAAFSYDDASSKNKIRVIKNFGKYQDLAFTTSVSLYMLDTLTVSNELYFIAYDRTGHKMVLFSKHNNIYNNQTEIITDLFTVADFTEAGTNIVGGIDFFDNNSREAISFYVKDNAIYLYAAETDNNSYVHSFKFDFSTMKSNYTGPVVDINNNPVVFAYPSGIHLEYVNNDANIDLIVGEYAGNAKQLNVMYSVNGSSTVFNRYSVVRDLARFSFVNAADFNQDGLMDLIGTNSDSTTQNQTYIFIQQTDGSFIQSDLGTYPLLDYSPTTLGYKGITIEDINQDTYPDIILKSSSQYNPSLYYLNNGDGTFDSGHYVHTVKPGNEYIKLDEIFAVKLNPSSSDLSLVYFGEDSSMEGGRISLYLRAPRSEARLVFPDDPVKANHLFLGWALDAEGNKRIEDDVNFIDFRGVDAFIFTENITFFAIWESLFPTITFKDIDGNILGEVYTIESDSDLASVTYPNAPEIDGYTFVEWDTELPTSLTQSLIITSLYEINTYSITFNSNGGTAVSNLTADFNSTITKPNDPTKLGHTFSGWYVDALLTEVFVFDKMPLDGQTLNAKWTVNTYDVSFTTFEARDPLFDINLEQGETFVSIAGGGLNSAALTSNGRLFIWGDNEYGQIGDNTTVDKKRPIDITSQFNLAVGEKINFIGLGTAHSVITTTSNRIFTWGSNFAGQVGDNTLIDKTTPVDITSRLSLAANETILSVGVGANHTGVVTSNGRVLMWGDNGDSRLGDGLIADRTRPFDITTNFTLETDEKVVEIALSSTHSVARTSNGRVFTWGRNFNGQLGDGSTTRKTTPTNITASLGLVTGEKVSIIAAGGENTVLVTTNGRVFSFGDNQNGAVGDNTIVRRTSPINITSRISLNQNETIVDVSLGLSFVFVLTNQNRIFAWGRNLESQLGDGTTTDALIPKNITSNLNIGTESISSVALGDAHSMVLTGSGRIFTWGYNKYFQLGHGDSVDKTSPQELLTRKIFSESNENLAFGAAVVKPADPVKTGHSFNGWYTDASFTTKYDFTTMPASNLKLYAEFIKNVDLIFAGINGDSIETYTYIPNDAVTGIDYPTAPVVSGYTFREWSLDIPTVMGSANVTIQALYDANEYTITFNSNGGSSVESITADFNTSITKPTDPIKEGHTFIGWYTDESFTLDFTFDKMPFDVATLYAKWSVISYSATFTTYEPFERSLEFVLNEGEYIVTYNTYKTQSGVITSTGRLLTWGANGSGQLGDGTTSFSSRPKDISSSFNLDSDETFIDITFGHTHAMLLTSKGRVFSWGNNNFGQLGDGTVNNTVTPTEITAKFNLQGNETIVKIATANMNSAAVSSTGRVFTWGFNGTGELGNGTSTASSSPVDITSRFGFLENERVVSISMGVGHIGIVTSAGRVFTWGRNAEGQLGDGTNGASTNKNVPTNITNKFSLLDGETVVSISAGFTHTAALSSTGRVFMFGFNEFGALGDGTNQNRNIPTLLTLGLDYQEGESTKFVDTGNGFSGLVTTHGRIFMWGDNRSGQLGDKTKTNRFEPVEITTHMGLLDGESFASLQLSDDSFSLFLTTEGRLFSVGRNVIGELGHGDFIQRDIPKEVFERRIHTKTTSTHDFGSVFTAPTEPVKDGFIFNGWYTDSSLTTKFDFTTMPATNLHIYAEFLESVELKFTDIDGNTIASYIFDPNEAVTNVNYPDEPVVSGYTFKSWSLDIPTQMGTENITIQALYDINTYSITFNSNGGSGITTLSADFNSPITKPSDPTKEGHTFAGWYVDALLTEVFVFDKMPVDGQTLYAKWMINTYTITIGNMSEMVVDIFTTALNTYILTSSNQIYAKGYNLGVGLGDPNISSITKTYANITHVFNLGDDDYITSVFNSDGFTNAIVYFISAKHKVFALGLNTRGALGVEDETIEMETTPVDITENFDLALGEYIVKIHGMRFSAIALSNLGKIYSWGYNEYGQLMREARYVDYHEIKEVTEVLNLLPNEVVVDLAGHRFASMFITSQNRLIGVGQNYQKALFANGSSAPDRYASPVEISIPLLVNETIEIFRSTFRSGLLYTSSGRFIQWNDILVSSNNYLPEVKDLLLANEIILDIAVEDHLAFIITNQRVLAQGLNGYGSFGNNDTTSSNAIIDVTTYFLHENTLPIKIDILNQAVHSLYKDGTVKFNGYNFYHDNLANNTGILVPSLVDLPSFDTLTFEFAFDSDLNNFKLDDEGDLYFRGFYLDAALTIPYIPSTMPAEDVVLYAKYTPLLEYDLSNVTWAYTGPLTYNGNVQEVLLNPNTLPEGVTVLRYESNRQTNAGTYEITVFFNYNEDTHFEPTLTFTFVIEKAVFNMSNVKWVSEGPFLFDELEKQVVLEGLPAGLTATYTNDRYTNPGTYTTNVVYNYDSSNYQEVLEPTLTWTIIPTYVYRFIVDNNVILSQRGEVSDEVNVPVPTKEGFIFKGFDKVVPNIFGNSNQDFIATFILLDNKEDNHLLTDILNAIELDEYTGDDIKVDTVILKTESTKLDETLSESYREVLETVQPPRFFDFRRLGFTEVKLIISVFAGNQTLSVTELKEGVEVTVYLDPTLKGYEGFEIVDINSQEIITSVYDAQTHSITFIVSQLDAYGLTYQMFDIIPVLVIIAIILFLIILYLLLKRRKKKDEEKIKPVVKPVVVAGQKEPAVLEAVLKVDAVVIPGVTSRPTYIGGAKVDSGYYLEVTKDFDSTNRIIDVEDELLPHVLTNGNAFIKISQGEVALLSLKGLSAFGLLKKTPGSKGEKGYYAEVDLVNIFTGRTIILVEKLPPSSKKGHRWVRVQTRVIK